MQKSAVRLKKHATVRHRLPELAGKGAVAIQPPQVIERLKKIVGN
jgi:hypothetical protein